MTPIYAVLRGIAPLATASPFASGELMNWQNTRRSALLVSIIATALVSSGVAQTIYALDDDAGEVLTIRYNAVRQAFDELLTDRTPVGRLGNEALRLESNLGITSDGAYLMVGRETGLRILRRDRDGTLHALPEAPFGTLTRLAGVASHTRRSITTIYAIEQAPALLRIFEFDHRSEQLSLRGEAHPLGALDGATCLIASKHLLCALNRLDRTLFLFDIDPRSGELHPWTAGPFELPVWTPHPTQMLFDRQETTLVMNDAGSGVCSVLDVDRQSRELRYARPLRSTHTSEAQLAGFRKNGRAFWILGDRGVQVFDQLLAPQADVQLLFGPVGLSRLDVRERLLFCATRRHLAVVELDRSTELPIPHRGSFLTAVFRAHASAFVVVR